MPHSPFCNWFGFGGNNVYLRHIFIYNARDNDEIVINQKLTKQAFKDAPSRGVKVARDLFVNFCEDFQSAQEQGITDVLHSLVLNMDELRDLRVNANAEWEFKIYGRRQPIRVNFSEHKR